MNAPSPLVDHMQIAGYVPIADHGFALPAYRNVIRRGNAWYCAQSAIDGDRDAPIAGFEPLEDEVDHTIDYYTTISIGDPWHDVFLWRELAVAGTAQQIFEELSDHHNEIRSEAPLSFLDLSLAVCHSSTPEIAQLAKEYLTGKLGDPTGVTFFRQIIVRSGVALELRRHLHRYIPDYAAHVSELEFAVQEVTSKSFTVDLTVGASMILGAEHALSHLKGAIARFGDQIGVEIDIAELKEIPTSDLIDAPPPELPDVETETARVMQSPTRRRRRSRLLGLAKEIAIDLGTSRTRIYESRKGTILDEPSAVAIKTIGRVKRVYAVGHDAKLMAGKTPDNIEVIYPLRDGAIADSDVVDRMLMHFVTKIRGKRSFIRPLDVILCVPLGSTSVERSALRHAAEAAGASRVTFIDATMAAAIGAGLPVSEPLGSMIVALGSGVTQVALIALGSVVYEVSYRVGGEKMDECIISYVRRNHNLLIGYSTAERVREALGTAMAPEDGVGQVIHIRGRCLLNGIPKEVALDQKQVAEALSEPVANILEAIRIALEHVAPELAVDVLERGITLSGGGALLGRLNEFLMENMAIQVKVAADPQNCITRGLARVLEDDALRSVLRPV